VRYRSEVRDGSKVVVRYERCLTNFSAILMRQLELLFEDDEYIRGGGGTFEKIFNTANSVSLG
jgi:hypothetical protein